MNSALKEINKQISMIMAIANLDTITESDAEKIITYLSNIKEATKDIKLAEKLADELFTTLAVALVEFVSKYRPESAQNIGKFLNLRDFLSTIWYLSGFRGGRPALRILAGKGLISSKIEKKFLLNIFLFFPLEAIPTELLRLSEAIPDHTFSHVVVSFLNQIGFVDPAFEKNMEEMLNGLKSRSIEINQDGLPQALVAWFHSSYLNIENRYTVKDFVNKYLQSRLPTNTARRITDSKDNPNVIVVLEVMDSKHAMGRIYYEKLIQLKEHFNVTLIVSNDSVADGILSEFDCLIVDFNKESIRDIVRKIAELKPQAAYFPSVGMSPMGIMLANCRIAPIQILSTGHPDTTQSEHMDFAIINSSGGTRELEIITETYNEKPIFTGSYFPSYGAPLPDASYVKYSDKLIENRPVVAINCKHLKINDKFLNSVGRISEAFAHDIHMKFFPGIKSETARLNFEIQLRRRLPCLVTVNRQAAYDNFIELLSEADLALTPFPFGNTNSTVDALCIGIATIVLESLEVRAAGDARMLRFFGLEKYIATTPVEYVDLAVRELRNNFDHRSTTGKPFRLGNRSDILNTFRSAGSNDNISQCIKGIVEETP